MTPLKIFNSKYITGFIARSYNLLRSKNGGNFLAVTLGASGPWVATQRFYFISQLRLFTTNLNLKSVKVYTSPRLQKKRILLENREITCIYR